MKAEHYRKLEQMYLRAKSQSSYYQNITIDIQAHQTTITLPVVDKYFHALNAMHGSVYFKLLDDASFFAVNAKIKDVFVLTTSFNINLLRPVDRGIIKAVGQTQFISKNLFVGKADLYNQEGKLIAFGTGNFSRSRIPLSEEIGYKLKEA